MPTRSQMPMPAPVNKHCTHRRTTLKKTTRKNRMNSNRTPPATSAGPLQSENQVSANTVKDMGNTSNWFVVRGSLPHSGGVIASLGQTPIRRYTPLVTVDLGKWEE